MPLRHTWALYAAPVFYLYLFFDDTVPRPHLSEQALAQGTALLMGIYEAREEAQRRLQALGGQIDAALGPSAEPRRPPETASPD